MTLPRNEGLSSALSMLSIVLFLSASVSAQTAGELSRETIPGTEVSFEMAFIKGGRFSKKAGPNQKEIEMEVGDFWMGIHELTIDEFALFQEREKDSDLSIWEEGQYDADAITRPTPPYIDITFGMGSTEGFPIVNTTQQAALWYCYWLYQKTGQFYRLPTESEWEYACRAGSANGVPSGNTDEELEAYAWYYDNSNEEYHQVGQKKPNAWGLYDMIGNVAEWTLDQYVDDYTTAVESDTDNPWIKPTRRHSRTVKGGSYEDYKEDCNCSTRMKSQPRWQQRDPQIPKSIWWNTDSPFVGFRIVRPVQRLTASEVEAFFQKALKY